ncbi:MAG: TGS domain-containing protein [Candidatus Aenigmarchaeota archaeon]|nr:TGS domain-containing protein [Candidatus Aenigmarchaeota archaeon]
MPINASPLYYVAEERYLNATTKEEKITCLEEMIRELPKHKGTENLLAQLKRKLAKLKAQEGKKKGARSSGIEKTGDAQICIMGETNSGKSSMLKELTGKIIKINENQYTTTKPEVAILNYGGAKLQLIELPATFENEHLSLLTSCDIILALCENQKEKKKLGDLIKGKRVLPKTIFIRSKADLDLNNLPTADLKISTKTGEGLEELKKIIWNRLKLIRVYTRTNNKVEGVPVVLKKDASVRNFALEIHKDLFDNFKFARVFEKEKPGSKRVGLKYKLKDGYIVEIHTN